MATQIFELQNFDWAKANQLLDALLKIESAEDFCKAMVHSGFSGGFVQGCHLFGLDRRAQLTKVSGYGVEFDHLDDTFSIWDGNPVAGAVRSKTIEFTEPSPTNRPLIVVPLIRGNAPIGAVALVLEPSVVQNPIDVEVLKILDKISGYWLGTVNENAEANPILKPSQRPEGFALTSRQIQIIQFMSEGLVNAQIAPKLLVSESTVRQETVRIYRELGVANRQEAAAKARTLGLIKPPVLQ